MTSREGFNAVQPQPVIQNMRLAFSADGTAIYKPVAGTPQSYQSSSAGGNSTSVSVAVPQPPPPPPPHQGVIINTRESVKKKRGRPRKYGPDGAMTLVVSPTTAVVPVTQSPGAFPPTPAPPSGGPASFSPTPPPSGGSAAFSPNPFSPTPPSAPSGGSVPPPSGGSAPTPSGGSAPPVPSESSSKKGRGRPTGSNKRQQMEALGLGGLGFTPHVITVNAGEDVASKIMSFSQIGPRTTCILAANGAISNVTLRQASTYGGTVTYEGRFEILSLTGSFVMTESAGQRSRAGGLSVSLSGPDGRVLGGSVAGVLTAASSVQVIVGSFIADGRKDSKKQKINKEPSLPAQPKPVPSTGAMGPSSPPSRGTLSESSGGPGSPPNNHSTGACNNNNNNNQQGMSSMPWK